MVDQAERSLSLAARVYVLLRQIPRGYVVTYGALARAAGCRSARAIGQILRKNPDAPDVPCHRVIRADLSLGGYAGKVDGPDVKRKMDLLVSEGVDFVNGKLKDRARLWYFPSQLDHDLQGCRNRHFTPGGNQ